MGQQSSSIQQANRLYQMPLSQYRLKERANSAISYWTHKSTSYDELIESRMIVTTQKELQNIYDIFRLRHMHIYLSPSRHLTCELQGIKGCGGYYKGNIYVQSPIITLAMINDIPFYDSLHLLFVAIKGFQILYRKFGYFQIFEDMFHIYQSGKLKVWCNSEVYKLGPQSYLLDNSGKEDDMVYKIINLIDENVDRSQSINIKRILYNKIHPQTHFKSFQHINKVLREVCKQNNWQIPQKLRCITHLSKQQMERLQNFQHIGYNQNAQIIMPQAHNANNNLLSQSSLNQKLVNNIKQPNEGKTSIRFHPQMNNDYIRSNKQSSPSIVNTHQRLQTFGQAFNPSYLSYPASKVPTATSLTMGTSKSVQQVNNTLFPTNRRQQTHVNRSQPQMNIHPTFRSFSTERAEQQCIRSNKFYSPINKFTSQNTHVVKYASKKQAVEQLNVPAYLNHSFSARSARPSQNRAYPFQNYIRIKPESAINPAAPHIPVNSKIVPTNPLKVRQQQIRNDKITNFCHNSSHKYLQAPSTLSTFTTISIPAVTTPAYITNNKIVQSNYTKLSGNFQQNNNNQDKLLKSIIINDPIKTINKQKLIERETTAKIQSNQNEKYCFQFESYQPTKNSISKIIQKDQTIQNNENNQKQYKTKKIQSSQSNLKEVNFQSNIMPANKTVSSEYISQKKKQFEAKKLQILRKYPNYKNYSKGSIVRKQQSDFTDPRLMQLLSQNQKPSNMKHTEYNLQLMNPFSALQHNKKSEQNSQLFYSFSKIVEDINPQNNSNCYESSGKFIQVQQEVMNSQSVGNLSKRYGADIDKQIWKDLVQLKKHKNLY